MLKILLVGASGAMGHAVLEHVSELEDARVVAGFQEEKDGTATYQTFTSFAEVSDALADGKIELNMIIDFSTPALTRDLTKFVQQHSMPVVLATTGHDKEQQAMIAEASQHAAILDTHNTSIGVTVMSEAVKQLTKSLYPLGYDIEIIEKHHRYKVDSPSGTAIMLYAAAESSIQETITPIYGRHGLEDERQHSDIGVHAVRGGNIVGEHTVIFANNEETIEITHRAGSKNLFATGALTGARFLAQAQPGLYSMKDVIQAQN